MAHKVHPYVFRIGQVTDWKSRWLSKSKKQYREYLKEDREIKSFVMQKLGRNVVANLEIERFPKSVNVIIFTSRPGLIIGRGGEGVEKLKEEIEKKILKIKPGIKKKDRELKIEIREVKHPEARASIVAANIAAQIERRIPTKRVMKRTLDQIKTNKDVKGAKIKVSGRIDGAEIARKEWISFGSVPLQSFRSDIDYAEAKAFCTYGVVGIKVWIYKGEKL